MEEKEGKVGMDPKAQPFRPRGEGEGVMKEDMMTGEEGEEEWCLVGRGGEWDGSESGGSSFKGDGSQGSSERVELREVVGQLQEGRKGGKGSEKSEAKTEDSGDIIDLILQSTHDFVDIILGLGWDGLLGIITRAVIFVEVGRAAGSFCSATLDWMLVSQGGSAIK